MTLNNDFKEPELSDEEKEELEHLPEYSQEEITRIQEAYRTGDKEAIAEIEKRYNQQQTEKIVTKLHAEAPGFYTDLSKPEDTDATIEEYIERFEESKSESEDDEETEEEVLEEEKVPVTSGFRITGEANGNPKTEQQPVTPPTSNPQTKTSGFRIT